MLQLSVTEVEQSMVKGGGKNDVHNKKRSNNKTKDVREKLGPRPSFVSRQIRYLQPTMTCPYILMPSTMKPPSSTTSNVPLLRRSATVCCSGWEIPSIRP